MPRRSKKKTFFSTLAVVTVVVLVYQWWTGSPPTAPVTETTDGGNYGTLTVAQRRLVDDWVARYDSATGAKAEPAAVYNGLALSTKTTLDAVTHALSLTRLSSAAGESLNLTALDLVTKIDAVAGNIQGLRGDKQFRLYVQLRPDAQEMLAASREFSRQVDNSVYHVGYPICFRGTGGTPSIQFSIATDGVHGDIDVDYRSSAFPIMLINGHLTASNSDVRAGNNDERHNGRWTGLTNWWRGFLGMPMADAPAGSAADGVVANEPRLGKGTKPEDAIFDFLNAWLVEQAPASAAGYIAPRTFSCLELDSGVPVDRGVARFQIVSRMQSVNRRLGKLNALGEVLRGVPLTNTRANEIAQAHRDAFVMYDVREDLAEAFDCENRLHPEGADSVKAQSAKFGDYIGAVFQVRGGDLTGEVVATLWAKTNDAWTLVSYEVDPEFAPGVLLSAPPPASAPAQPATTSIAGDPAMLRAASDFLQAWYVRKDPAAAIRYLSPSSFACYNVYKPDNAPQAGSSDDARRLIQEQMKLLADWAGTGSRLDDMLVAAEPHHPDLKLVNHENAGAYSIVVVPDAMAMATDCGRLRPGETPKFERGAPATYGRYYAVSLQLKRAGAEAGVLWTVWAKPAQSWTIVSYLAITP